MKHKEAWANIAPKLLKGELLKRNLTYNDLREKLAALGIENSEENIKNKLSRGSFNVIFFLQSLRAIGVKNLLLEDAIFEETE